MPADPEATLENLLAKSTLSPSEAQEGLVACFMVINRAFVKRRMMKRAVIP